MGKTPHRRQQVLTRKQTSRREREQRMRQQLLVGAGAVLLLIVAILGWGLVDHYVLRPRRPVATVHGAEISLGEYQRLVRYRRWDYRGYLEQLQGQRQQAASAGEDQAFLLQYLDQQVGRIQSELMNLPLSVLDEMIDDRIIRQESARRGIVVSAEEVQQQLEEQFGYERNPALPTPEPTSALPDVTNTGPDPATPTPTVAPVTQEQFVARSSAWFESARRATGFTEADLRYLLEGSLYRTRLSEAIRAEAPATAEQAHARHILVETREEAESVLARLEAGEEFAALAAEISLDSSNKDEGGDLGWFPRGQMAGPFDDAAFALQPGETSGAVETEFGVHVIRVEGRDAGRPLEGMALEQAQEQVWQDWLAAQRRSDQVVRQWSSAMAPADLPTPRPAR